VTISILRTYGFPGVYILDGLITLDLVGRSNLALGAATLGNTLTGTGHAGVEVHAVDTNRRIVLDTQIDVFADTEAEVASLREVALAELILLYLQSTLQDLLSLRSADGNVNSDLLVTTDTEGTDGVAGLAWVELETMFCRCSAIPLSHAA
jgi:hypothetical protein